MQTVNTSAPAASSASSAPAASTAHSTSAAPTTHSLTQPKKFETFKPDVWRLYRKIFRPNNSSAKILFGRKIFRPKDCSAENITPEKKYPADQVFTRKSRAP